MSRKLVLASIVLLLSAFVAAAQDDVVRFRDAAGNESLLYRGRKVLDYRFPFNGTYYWYGAQFGEGEVCYNGKIYPCRAMNIDAAQQELIVRSPDGVFSVLLNRDHVKWFTLGGRKYINAQLWFDDPDVPEGFFEVLYEGRVWVLKQIRKTLDRMNNPEMADTGMEGVPLLANVFEVFQRKISVWYVDPDGAFSRINRRSDVYKRYRQHRRELKAAIAREEPDELVLSLDEFARIAVEIGEGLR